MATLKLAKSDFKKSSRDWSDYIGKKDVSNYKGHIEIEENLGWVKFKSLSATGYIFAKAGTGITVKESIKAGWAIRAGWGIKAGTAIRAQESIRAGTAIRAGWAIER